MEKNDISTTLSNSKIKLLQSKNNEIIEDVQAIINKLDKLNQEIQKQFKFIKNAREKGDVQL